MYIFTDETLRYLISKIKSQIASKKSLDSKVDKVDNKYLSDNDFTNEAISSLDDKYDSVDVKFTTGKANLTFKNHDDKEKTLSLKVLSLLYHIPIS